jgi:hypothetical protein
MAKIILESLTRPYAMHPREAQIKTGVLASANAEIIIDCDGCSTVALDLRDTFSLTIEVAGTIDGVNWTLIPMRPLNQASVLWVAAIAGTTQGIWLGKCAPFLKVRARVTAWTSGSAVATILADNGAFDEGLLGGQTALIATTTAASGIAATLTLPSPGAALRLYLTYVALIKFAAAATTAAAAPVLVTTTNLPGGLAFTLGAEALAQGALAPWREDLAYALAASAQNTAATLVAPAVPGVIWRLTAGYFVAP